jgi:hypothetical protein
MKTFIIACALLGLDPEGEMIPARFLEICPEEPPVYTSLAACKRQAKRVARAVNSPRFTATCEQRVWYLFTPTGVGSNQTFHGTYETVEQCHAAADQLKQRGDDININAWCTTTDYRADKLN